MLRWRIIAGCETDFMENFRNENSVIQVIICQLELLGVIMRLLY